MDGFQILKKRISNLKKKRKTLSLLSYVFLHSPFFCTVLFLQPSPSTHTLSLSREYNRRRRRPTIAASAQSFFYTVFRHNRRPTIPAAAPPSPLQQIYLQIHSHRYTIAPTNFSPAAITNPPLPSSLSLLQRFLQIRPCPRRYPPRVRLFFATTLDLSSPPLSRRALSASQSIGDSFGIVNQVISL